MFPTATFTLYDKLFTISSAYVSDLAVSVDCNTSCPFKYIACISKYSDTLSTISITSSMFPVFSASILYSIISPSLTYALSWGLVNDIFASTFSNIFPNIFDL